MPHNPKTHDARAATVAEIVADAKKRYQLDPTIRTKFPNVYDYLRSIFRALDLGACNE